MFDLDKKHSLEGPAVPLLVANAGLISAGAAVVGAGVAIKGSIDAKKAAGKQADAQRRSQQTQQRINDLETARQRRSQVRQARQQRAEIVASSGAGGLLDSSSSVTGAGSVGSQLGSNISFLDQTQGLARQASIFNIQAAGFQGKAASAEATGALGSTIFTAAGGFGSIGEGIGQSKALGNPDKFFS